MDRARTSQSHPLRVDFVETGLPGRLGLTFAPGKKDRGATALWDRDLEADLARLRQGFGADALVCLLEDRELERMAIAELVPRATAAGLEPLRLPIPDSSVPTSDEAFAALVEGILGRLREGRTVVVHCRGGLGRTGMTAAACLVALGAPAREAIARVRQVRPWALETPEQERYVERFAAARARPR